MKVLIACEESQIVCKEFRNLGHEAYSCDILDCSGGHPEWHIKGDVLEELDKDWDLIIAHPPCTYLSHAGARWLYPKGVLNIERYDKGLLAKEFFLKLLNCKCKKVVVENPLPSSIYDLPKHTQLVHPYYFGDEAQKRTLLWIKGLPNLSPTKMVGKGEFVIHKSGKRKAKWFQDLVSLPPHERAIARSKTFPGIAKAMAERWGKTQNSKKPSEDKG